MVILVDFAFIRPTNWQWFLSTTFRQICGWLWAPDFAEAVRCTGLLRFFSFRHTVVRSWARHRTAQPTDQCRYTNPLDDTIADSEHRNNCKSSWRHGRDVTVTSDGVSRVVLTTQRNRRWSDKPTSSTATYSGWPVTLCVITASNVPPSWWVAPVACSFDL